MLAAVNTQEATFDIVAPPITYNYDQLYETLHELCKRFIRGAEEEEWPYIPEVWQFVDSAEAAGLPHIKTLLNSPNSKFTDKTEINVLMMCLEAALNEKRWWQAMSILFVIDRHVYWLGETEMLLQTVDEIRRVCPEIHVPPQIVIRKARVLKDKGAVQEADRILAKVLADGMQDEFWTYRSAEQFCVIAAVCIEVKGEIRQNLGMFIDAAEYVIRSVSICTSLTEPDRKGIASGLQILSNLLRNLSVSDYAEITKKFRFEHSDPLVEAHFLNKHAAYLVRFDPFFFSRQKRKSAESLLLSAGMKTAEIPSISQIVDEAVEELKQAIRALSFKKSLQSRDQFHEFITNWYQMFLAISIKGEKDTALNILKTCSLLYRTYCTNKSLSAHEIANIDELLSSFHLPSVLEDFGTDVDKQEYLKELKKSPIIYPTLMSEDPLSWLSEEYRTRFGLFTVDVDKAQVECYGMAITETADPHAITLAKMTADPRATTLARTTADPRATSLARMTADPRATTLARMTVDPQATTLAKMTADPQATTLVRMTADPKATTLAKMTADPQATTWARMTTLIDPNEVAPPEVVAPEVSPTATTQEHPGESMKPTHAQQMLPQTRKVDQRKATWPQDQDDRMSFLRKNKVTFKEVEKVDKESNQIDQKIDEKEIPIEVDPTKPESLDVEKDMKTTEIALVSGSVTDRKLGIWSRIGSINTTNFQSMLAMPESSYERSPLTRIMGTTPASHQIFLNPSPCQPQTSSDEKTSSEKKILNTRLEKSTVYEATLMKYHPLDDMWQYQKTMVYIDDQLNLPKEKEGRMRNVIKLQYIHQEECKSWYLGKRFKNQQPPTEYYNDVIIHQIARHYVSLFNKALEPHPEYTNQIQMVPVVHLQIIDKHSTEVMEYLNVEPYIDGSFSKMTNNHDFITARVNTDVLTAFSHFTWHQSGGRLMVTDLQGWVPSDRRVAVILTDPAINSEEMFELGLTNIGERGLAGFWSTQHPRCNVICKLLGMLNSRPAEYPHREPSPQP